MNQIKYDGISQNLEGFYKVYVIDAITNEVVFEQPDWKHNLILNQGMDSIASRYYNACMYYAIAGTGTRNNSIWSGNSKLSQAGTTITLTDTSGVLPQLTASVGGYTYALQVGDAIVYATSSTIVNVVGSITDMTATVDTSTSITNEQFTIWKTSQVGLQTEVKRAGTGITDSYFLSGGCGYTFINNTIELYRTYDFSAEAGSVTYTEIGVGWSTSGASTVFSRILLDTPITIGVGQRLRVVYKLAIQCTPATVNYRTDTIITGWPVAPSTTIYGSESLQKFDSNVAALGLIDTNGNNTGEGSLEPFSSGQNCTIFLSYTSTDLSLFGSATTRNGDQNSSIKVGYTNGNYYIDKYCIFSAAQSNRNDLQSMGFGYYNPLNQGYQVYCFRFDQPQTKTNVQTLTLAFRFRWSRILSNGS